MEIKARSEDLVRKTISKIVQSVLLSRIEIPNSPKRINKSFHLEAEESEHIQKTLESAIFNPQSGFKNLFVLEIHFDENQGLGINTIVESWRVIFEPFKDIDISIQLPKFYRNVIILVRTIYAMLRNIPCYTLYRNFTKNRSSTCSMKYQIRICDMQTISAPSFPLSTNVKNVSFTTIPSPLGNLKIDLVYKENLSREISISSQLGLESQFIIKDYNNSNNITIGNNKNNNNNNNINNNNNSNINNNYDYVTDTLSSSFQKELYGESSAIPNPSRMNSLQDLLQNQNKQYQQQYQSQQNLYPKISPYDDNIVYNNSSSNNNSFSNNNNNSFQHSNPIGIPGNSFNDNSYSNSFGGAHSNPIIIPNNNNNNNSPNNNININNQYSRQPHSLPTHQSSSSLLNNNNNNNNNNSNIINKPPSFSSSPPFSINKPINNNGSYSSGSSPPFGSNNINILSGNNNASGPVPIKQVNFNIINPSNNGLGNSPSPTSYNQSQQQSQKRTSSAPISITNQQQPSFSNYPKSSSTSGTKSPPFHVSISPFKEPSTLDFYNNNNNNSSNSNSFNGGGGLTGNNSSNNLQSLGSNGISGSSGLVGNNSSNNLQLLGSNNNNNNNQIGTSGNNTLFNPLYHSSSPGSINSFGASGIEKLNLSIKNNKINQIHGPLSILNSEHHQNQYHLNNRDSKILSQSFYDENENDDAAFISSTLTHSKPNSSESEIAEFLKLCKIAPPLNLFINNNDSNSTSNSQHSLQIGNEIMLLSNINFVQNRQSQQQQQYNNNNNNNNNINNNNNNINNF